MKRILFILPMAILLSACAIPVNYNRDITNFIPMQSLKLKVPSGDTKKTETPYMVAFVWVSYESTTADSVEQLNQSQKMRRQNSYQVMGSNMGEYRKMDAAQTAYFEIVKKSLQSDLEQVLLAKNIRVMGPFKTRDDMTFDEKKRAYFIFTPEILIKVDSRFRREQGMSYTEEGDVIVNGVVILTLRESITGEKIWVKRLDADTVTKPYRLVAKYKDTSRVEDIAISALKTSIKEEDNTDTALAFALSEFYTSLGDKLWKHIDAEEWGKYLNQADILRKEKRY